MSDLGPRRLPSAAHLCCNPRQLFKKKSMTHVFKCVQHFSTYIAFSVLHSSGQAVLLFSQYACRRVRQKKRRTSTFERFNKTTLPRFPDIREEEEVVAMRLLVSYKIPKDDYLENPFCPTGSASAI